MFDCRFHLLIRSSRLFSQQWYRRAASPTIQVLIDQPDTFEKQLHIGLQSGLENRAFGDSNKRYLRTITTSEQLTRCWDNFRSLSLVWQIRAAYQRRGVSAGMLSLPDSKFCAQFHYQVKTHSLPAD